MSSRPLVKDDLDIRSTHKKADLNNGLEAVLTRGGWQHDNEDAGEQDAGGEEQERLLPHGYHQHARHAHLHSGAQCCPAHRSTL